MKLKYLLLILQFIPLILQAQVTIKGKVYNQYTHLPIPKVKVILMRDSQETFTNEQGIFHLKVHSGKFTIKFSSKTYQTQTLSISIKNKPLDLGIIFLEPLSESLNPIVLSGLSGYVKLKNKPVAVTTLNALIIRENASVKDLPEILNSTPSVYATKKGGGIGDSRINIRGFDQRNIAVLINGVPVNDMQTGWVYWSNWLNLPEITSRIQLQPGMGASNLALPSVGGTINILTRSSDKIRGGFIKYIYHSYGLQQQSIGYNTGILKNGLSASIQFGHIGGKGYVDMTDVAGYTYYFNLNYESPNQKHHLMLNVLGAPQEHYQRNFAPRIQDYLKYSADDAPNIKYNSEWGYLHDKAYSWHKNYFHKPIISLNWDWDLNPQWQLSSVLYGIFGRGGGTDAIGAINYHYPNNSIYMNQNGQVRFDDIYHWNQGEHVPDFGQDRMPDINNKFINKIDEGLTRYAFMNNQAWYGAMFNLKHSFSDAVTINAGLDLRATSGKNALTVNDVLGANGYKDDFDINHPNRLIKPNEFVPATYDWNPFVSIDALSKIIFFNQSKINWSGLFGQIQYQSDTWSGFLQAGWSRQGFQRIDYFNLPKDQQKSDWVYLTGGNIKTGAGYLFDQKHQVYLNAGYFSKQPLYNAIFPNWSNNTIGKNLKNEKIYTTETGYRFKGNHFKSKFNLYYTLWQDRYETVTDFVNHQQVSGTLQGLKEVHKGIEWTGQIKFSSWRFYTMLSLGHWAYKGNIKNVKLYNFQQQVITNKNYYLDGIKVGDAAQFTAALRIQYRFNRHWRAFISQNYIDRLYAKIDAGSFSNPNHQGSLQLPAYSIVDTGLNFQTKIKRIGKLSLRFNIQNLFDKTYISESETNIFPKSGSMLWHGIDTSNRVFFGWGRTYALGLNLKI